MNTSVVKDSTDFVWIPEAEAFFNDLIGKQGHHSIVVNGEIYIQPPVYLTFHLIQMLLAGWDKIDFDTLAAVSGASALFAFQPQEFMPKYAFLSVDPDNLIADATGFSYTWEKFDDIEQAWEIIQKNIDKGLTLKGWDWENILFAGYQPGDSDETRRIFAMADGPETYARWIDWNEFTEWGKRVLNWGASSLGHSAGPIDRDSVRETSMRVIKRLIEWSDGPPAHVQEQYPQATFGLKGIEAYADWIETQPLENDIVACHDINGQWCLRNSTSVYLKSVADAKVYPGEINQHLLAASYDYHQAYESWREMYLQHIGHPVPVETRMTRANRKAAALTVCRAMMHEKSALHEINHVLQVERMA